ncbi:MAG: N-acetylneuraminate lyase [Candidatus Fimenecus sp.]
MKQFQGVYAALMTPFAADGSVDYEALKVLADHCIDAGLTGLYVGGSTGEGFLLTEDERMEVFRVVGKHLSGKCNLFAHVGAISTDSAIRMAKVAENSGFDAVSAVAPFYYSFPLEAIKTYYNDIMHATSLPMLMYNFPNAGGFNGMLDVVNAFIQDDKLLGIKHTSQNLFELEQFKHLERDLVVFNGYDEMLVAGLSMGADGGIGSTYNFMPHIILEIYNSFHRGDIATAQKAQEKANRMISAMLPYGVFQMEKEILKNLGLPVGACRKPFLPLSEEGKAKAKEIAEAL